MCKLLIMSSTDENTLLTKTRVVGKEKFQSTIQNTYFKGAGEKNIHYNELTPRGKKFVLWLVSYELNFEPLKIDYYYLPAKKIQTLFHVPGWILLLPNELITKKTFRKKILTLAHTFNTELQHNKLLSRYQAHLLNKAYNNFLWE